KVMELVGLFGAGAVVNHLDIAAADQVLLEVRIVEMQRTYLKQLGISTQGNTLFGDAETFVENDVLVTDTTTGFVTGTEQTSVAADRTLDATAGFAGAAADGGFSGSLGYQNFVGSLLQSEVGIDLSALERIGIARTLAEPNLTALSGEQATFLAGGEIPVPTPPNDQGISGIEYRPFGVSLGFTPEVLSENRISLNISTEVSEIAAQGAVSGVPAFTTRNVQSTVELPSGRSMMLAGLIQSRVFHQLDQLPGLKNIPILGALAQSREFSNDETELVIIVTPYLVQPSRKQDLRSPADGFSSPTDREALLFGKLNRMYGKDEAELTPENYKAPVGFIEE
ncbi:MAG: type II and III secretion system protein family protein, partial [Pseudomonadota bacterium]